MRINHVVRYTHMRYPALIMLAVAVMAATALNACWGETMKVYPSTPLEKALSTYTPVGAGAVLLMSGAAGETVSAQAVVVPGDKADEVTARLSALRTADGRHEIKPAAVRLQWVRYMHITTNTANVPADELVAKAPASIPDPFWEDADRAIEPGSPQPLWIELDLPPDAAPGIYQGELTVNGNHGRAALPVSLRLRAFGLSEEPHQHVIQWWDVPGRTFEALKPGTDEYWKHLEGMCRFVRRHRQTDVRIFWSLVQQKAGDSGKQSWDTSLVERFVDTAFGCGIRAVQFDAVARHSKFQLEQDVSTVAVEENMGKLAAVEQLVVKRKWQGRVFTSIVDEPFIFSERSYRQVLDQVRKAAPHVGVVEAIETDDIGDLDIYVPKLSHLNLWWPAFERLKEQGRTVWFYTCCHPQGRYPNRFLDQPLLAARQLHWISYLYDLDGYLHWGLNWFAPGEDPYSEKGANQWSLPPGDGQVAYPGKSGFLGSLRLSAMRDGLQDYEYLWTLEQKLRKLKSRLGSDGKWIEPRQRPLELCRRVVQSFYDRTRDPEALLRTREAIADEIESLDARPLLYVQTSPPEGTVTPAGPTMINVRGVVTPGAAVSINGQPVVPGNISPKGYFIGEVFIEAGKAEVVVEATLDGSVRQCKRTFMMPD